MPLPLPNRVWEYSVNNRIDFNTTNFLVKEELFKIKEFWKAGFGVTVKGSSDAVNGAMDGVDRLDAPCTFFRASTTTAAQSWIVLTCTGLGGADLLITYQGGTDAIAKIAFSPGGLYTIAGTATFQPTATDEQNLAAVFEVTTECDRYVHLMRSADGTSFRFIITGNGKTLLFCLIETVQSALSPTVMSWVPATIVVGLMTATVTPISSLVASVPKVYLNGISCTAVMSGENAGGQYTLTSTLTTNCELNEDATVLGGFNLLSTTYGARGKIGNFIDLWFGVDSPADGDTLPLDASHQFAFFGSYVVKWNGTMPGVL